MKFMIFYFLKLKLKSICFNNIIKILLIFQKLELFSKYKLLCKMGNEPGLDKLDKLDLNLD